MVFVLRYEVRLDNFISKIFSAPKEEAKQDLQVRTT